MAVRRKKKSSNWKGFLAGVGLAAIFGLVLIFAAAGPSGARMREAFRTKMSVMADRADQLVNAWNRRQVPGADKPAKPEPKPLERPALTPAQAAAEDRPVLAPLPPLPPLPAASPETAPPPADPAAATPAPKPSPKVQPPPPDKDITPDDQKQLRELMQKLNQGT